MWDQSLLQLFKRWDSCIWFSAWGINGNRPWLGNVRKAAISSVCASLDSKRKLRLCPNQCFLTRSRLCRVRALDFGFCRLIQPASSDGNRALSCSKTSLFSLPPTWIGSANCRNPWMQAYTHSLRTLSYWLTRRENQKKRGHGHAVMPSRVQISHLWHLWHGDAFGVLCFESTNFVTFRNIWSVSNAGKLAWQTFRNIWQTGLAKWYVLNDVEQWSGRSGS